MAQLFVFDPPYMRQRTSARIDYWGIGLLVVGIGALQIVLDKGQQEDWFASRSHHAGWRSLRSPASLDSLCGS